VATRVGWVPSGRWFKSSRPVNSSTAPGSSSGPTRTSHRSIFSQRFTGALSDDAKTIEGTWKIAHDHANYENDFDISYRKVA